MSSQKTCTHKCTCWSPLLCRMTLDSCHFELVSYQNVAPSAGAEPCTCLTEGLCKLRIKVSYNGGHLTFQREFMSRLYIQPGRVDDCERDPIELGLADLDCDGMNVLRPPRWPTEVRTQRRALCLRCRGGDLCSLKEQP